MKFVLVVLDFLFFYYLFFFLTFIYDGRFILFFLIPHPWEVPRNRLSGCFPEPLVLLSQFS